jgi:3-isopropylmalate dehydratase small subunit
VGNAGCAGCAEGQIGQNGPGEVTVSTGNRNFAGKQGQGKVYLASPATAAACAVAGVLTTAAALRAGRVAARRPSVGPAAATATTPATGGPATASRPTQLTGRVWVVRHDNVDTDMIFHNRHLAITDVREMGQHAFGNLEGMKAFATAVKPGDVVVAGKNFGCGSSRQQAVDCFAALGVAVIVADSFGAIYERNAVNNAFPVLVAPGASAALHDGEVVTVDLAAGTLRRADGSVLSGKPFSKVQMDIYQRGGLLAR